MIYTHEHAGRQAILASSAQYVPGGQNGPDVLNRQLREEANQYNIAMQDISRLTQERDYLLDRDAQMMTEGRELLDATQKRNNELHDRDETIRAVTV